MNHEKAEDLFGDFMGAVNFFGAIISPTALAKVREVESDQKLGASLQEAIRACLKLLTKVTSGPETFDPAKAKELLTPLLESPELIDFEKPAALVERLRAAVAALGIPLGPGDPALDSAGSGDAET